MITTEEIKKELDAGREVELECVDKNDLLGTINPKRNYNQLILESSLQVSRYFIDGEGLTVFVIEPGLMITEVELKYFRIKRPAPTFDDLIDVICKAFKNGIQIGNVEFVGCGVSFELFHDDIIYKDNQRAISAAINWINSLYTETFVIEHASDIKNIKKTAIIRLENDNEVCAESNCLHNGVNFIQTTYGGMNFNLSFVSLKGATVTQKRGEV